MKAPALLGAVLAFAMFSCSKPVPLTGEAARAAACSATGEYFTALEALRRDPDRAEQDLSRSRMRELVTKAVENGKRSNDQRIQVVAQKLGQDLAFLGSGAVPSVDPTTGQVLDADTATEDAVKQQTEMLRLCGLPNPLKSPAP